MGQQIAETRSWNCSWATGDENQQSESGRIIDRIDDPEAIARRQGQQDLLAGLVSTIETEIIPRLVLARTAPSGEPDVVAPGFGNRRSLQGDREDLVEGDVDTLTRIVLGQQSGSAAGFIETVRARGVPLSSVYLDLLAPTARQLGLLWEADLCDFSEVTVGLGRLQQALRDLGPAFRTESPPASADGSFRALLMPAPGEKHTFGVVMVAEFFLRAGWDVWGGPLTSPDELVGIVRGEWFDLVGLSVGHSASLLSLTQAIKAIRRASRNADVIVMVGGPIFVEHPELVSEVGADATAVDGRQAPLQAEALLSRMASRA